MFVKLFASAAMVIGCAQVGWAQAAPAAPAPHGEAAATAPVPAPALVGTWKAPTERLPLTGDFNEKVWGRDAVSVRDVTLTIKPTGEAVLTIARKVLDARGRTVPGSSSVEEANLTLGATRPGFATRVEHAVTVVKAERRYPDTPGDRWPLENLRVNVVSFSDGQGTLEVRFDPPDGQGAFAERLSKQGAAARTASR